jgi:hypothetical protein
VLLVGVLVALAEQAVKSRQGKAADVVRHP